MSYFNSSISSKNLLKFSDKPMFQIGGIFSLFFRTTFLNFFFEGICISLRRRNTPEFSFTLRNVIGGTGIELCLSFFYNRAFFFKASDYKKKTFKRNRSKLIYLRTKMNRESRVK